MVRAAGRVVGPAVVEAQIGVVAHVAIAPCWHAVCYAEVRGVFRRAGECALVEEIPLRGRKGDVCVESADAVGSGFVVVVAGEERDFGESAGFAECGIICEDGGVVDGRVERCLSEGLSRKGWNVACGGENFGDAFATEAGESICVCGIFTAEGAGHVVVDGS